MSDFIYSSAVLPCGIRLEEINGGEGLSERVRELLAWQIYNENGRNGYRTVSHFDSGAPCADGYEGRISVSHTPGLLAVASLPRTPEADLSLFSPRTCMGVDVERKDRSQVLKVRERFLSPAELELVPADSVEKNLIAWTAKEAMLKAGMNSKADIRADLVIESLPVPDGENGKGHLHLPDGSETPLDLCCRTSGDYLITIAFSPKCATFKKIG